MHIDLPDAAGRMRRYEMSGAPCPETPLPANPARVVYAAAHVVADPFAETEPSQGAAIDWEASIAFRRRLAGLGLGIAEAMDTAQRGMGLGWEDALTLIRHTKEALPDAMVANGCGTEQLAPQDAGGLDDVIRAYVEQAAAIQKLGGRLVLMASRALARVARGPDDYAHVYGRVLAECDAPVVLHWLGDMFDPELAGYWGADEFAPAMESALAIIESHASKIDGIKISLLDKDKEIEMRRRLPAGVRMYSGDDFNYPELMAGDEHGHSDALLGAFDPLAAHASAAVGRLGAGDVAGFRTILDPTVPLARLIFRAPTQYYKTGVVFLAWLNGFQEHFVMLGGAQAMRPLPYFADLFRLADQCGALRDSETAAARMRRLLAVYGL